MKRVGAVLSVIAGIGTIALLGPTGCERAEDTAVITIRPNPVEVTSPNSAVLLTATGGLRSLSFPLTWTVSNTNFGTIDPVYRGDSAVYVSGASGRVVNVVTVVDQYGAEGHATVTHNYSSTTNGTGDTVLDVRADNGTIPVGQNSTRIEVTPPDGTNRFPYTWYVGDPNYGDVRSTSTTSTTNTYTSFRTGRNTVYVTDADGRRGHVSIEQL